MHRLFSFLLVLLFLTAGFVLGISNPQSVPFHMIVIDVQWPLSVLLAAMFALGALLSAVYMGLKLTRMHWQNQRLKHQINQQAREQLHWQRQQQSDRHNQTRETIHQALEQTKSTNVPAARLPVSQNDA
ncbi:LapA family protein [Thiomicrospira sp. WB1]|jgi:uncharacterized membrane protein YciS (DUF1049 family)|uniref:LapA family protein n=1 Tax=Thiomicrospira sp. WB1 TaxID=1685380 RepID=UPI00074AEA9D|nr:LapA family protein [Thiomicrospira sp. WB1]KUJ72039.1 hypothetical protein AVO41_06260 [Thiomicrospira sp. WB1]